MILLMNTRKFLVYMISWKPWKPYYNFWHFHILFHVVILTVRYLVRSFALTHILGSPLFIASLLSFVTPEIKMIIFMADKMWTLQLAMISLWHHYKWCHARSGRVTQISLLAEPWCRRTSKLNTQKGVKRCVGFMHLYFVLFL